MIRFILTPDSSTSQLIRGELAQQNKIGIKVGTFSGLLDLLAEYWLIPKSDIDWHKTVRDAARNMKEAFWAKSLDVDEEATIAQIKASLELLLQGVSLKQSADSLTLKFDDKENHTNKRLKGYFEDIVKLWQKIDSQRPAEQMLAKCWLEQAKQAPIEPVVLQLADESVELLLWQREVTKALLENPPASAEEVEFKTYDQPSKQTNFKLFSCQDLIAECEAVASMVQAQVSQGAAADELAIIVPKQNQDYAFWLRHYLNKGGIHLGNAQGEVSLVDWQRQLIRDLLNYQAQAKPKMQLFSLLVNPLMPWGSQAGNGYIKRYEMLQRFRDEREEQKSTEKAKEKVEKPISEEEQKKLAEKQAKDALFTLLIDEESSIQDVESLLAWVTEVCEQTKGFYKNVLSEKRMKEQLILLEDAFTNAAKELDNSSELALDELIQIVLKQWELTPIRQQEGARYLLNAVTLIHSDQSVYKSFKRLWVMGFNQGAYTEPVPNSGAIPFEAWQGLKLGSGQKYTYPHSYFNKQNWFENWLVNLGFSKEAVIVTNARQSLDGSLLYLSETWLPLAQKLGKEYDAEKFMRPIENAEHRLLRWSEVELKELEQTNQVAELQFDKSIFTMNEGFARREHERKQSKETKESDETKEFKPRLESPSSLEKLLVSPFDWLLNRLGIESAEWEVQSLDPATQGTVAHKVFELYAEKKQAEAYSEALFQELYEQAVEEDAAFLNEPQWNIEKANLGREIERAFIPFVQWLTNNDWQITQTEQEYEGDFSLLELKMKGYVDAVLEHKDQVFILDYKKSKSDDRIKRLEKGFDLQTLVYKRLYPQQENTKELPVITGYYNLNDQKMVTDAPTLQAGDDWKVCINQDVNQAIETLQKRIESLKQGRVPMTNPDMPSEWKKVGIKAYALENNSLVKRFAHENGENAKDLGLVKEKEEKKK